MSSISEIVAIVVSVCTFLVSVVALINALEAKDTKDAVRNLSMLARDTQNEANTAISELAELKREQRPLVFASNISLAEPAQHDDTGLQIQIAFSIVNSGHQPASFVTINLTYYAISPRSLRQYKPLELRNCAQAVQGFSGIAVFPNSGPRIVSYGTYLSNSEIEAHSHRHPATYTQPWILACIVYKDPNGVVYHTPYILDLTAVKNGRPCCVVPLDPADLSAAQLIIQEDPDAGLAHD